jgi:hypothetical protein
MTPNGATSDSWEKVLFVFLGWLLATLSPLIADAIRRRREVRESREALLAELAELKYRMALVVYLVEQQHGSVDRKLLEWLQPIIIGYKGAMPSSAIAKQIENELALTDEQVHALHAATRKPESALSLKSYPAPFLENRLKTISWFPIGIQALILEIHTQLGILEEERKNSEYFFRMSFDEKLSEVNRDRIEQNLGSTYKNASKAAKIIANRISELEKSWGKPNKPSQ